jgi:coenzyme F420-0:L-glutamate ligase / coenzyme F420-1:gamma-L-glutamate ligase
MPKLEIIPVTGLPIIEKGVDVGEIIVKAVKDMGESFIDGDILVIAHSIVSRAEGMSISLKEVVPSAFAQKIAEATGKDPRQVEVILRNCRKIVRMGDGVLICETPHGFVCANAGVDASNSGGTDIVIALPKDPDKSAENIRRKVKELTGVDVAVIISDTFGRPFRKGTINVAIGCSGINPLWDRRGEKDLFGRILLSKVTCIADELASAAELVMGQADEAVPAAIIRGYIYDRSNLPARVIIRDKNEDLFR